MNGHKKPVLSGSNAEWLRERIKSGSFTLRGLTAELAAHGIKTQQKIVWLFVHAEGLSYKKTVLPTEQARPDIARKRARWPKRLDETWVKPNMVPLRGWGPRGERLEARVPHGHWKTLTFIGALRHDRIEAPFVIDGPINGELFTAYVQEVLAPTLAKGDIVILDNLGSHKGRAANACRWAHMSFLPPYSPELNPIEQVFAKLKHLMRKAQPHTIKNTWRKAADLLDLFSPKECANYLTNSGYASV